MPKTCTGAPVQVTIWRGGAGPPVSQGVEHPRGALDEGGWAWGAPKQLDRSGPSVGLRPISGHPPPSSSKSW